MRYCASGLADQLAGAKTGRTVLRRYTDFRTLAHALRQELGADKALPPIPAKQRLGRVNEKEDKVEERRRALEAWLWDLLTDVSVAHSKALTTFLELTAARKGLTRTVAETAQAAADEPEQPALAVEDVRTPPEPADEPGHAASGPLQQRYARAKQDLSDALTCLRSDAAVKRLLAARCDELEKRLADFVQGGQAGGGAGARAEPPTADAAPPVRGSAEERSVELAWRLEEALAAGRAAQTQSAAHAEACVAAELRCETAAARISELEAALESCSAAADEAASRALAERKVLAKEVKQQRRDLAVAVEARAAAEAACESTATAAAASAAAAFQTRLCASLREAAALRRRLGEATVEHMGAENGAGSEPLELLALCDARTVALQAEAQLLCRIADAPAERAPAAESLEGQVRELLAELLSDTVVLRRRVNQLLRAQLAAAPPETPTRRR